MDPVIVAGAGPVGLSTALALARLGVPTVLLDEGPQTEVERAARTTVLRPETAAFLTRIGCTGLSAEGTHWSAWRMLHRRQSVRHQDLGTRAPLHLPQHALTRRLREALAEQSLAEVVPDCRLDTLEQDPTGVSVLTQGAGGRWWRGSYLIGCDGPRSTVRKLLKVRFPGRTSVERQAIAALRTELPWPGEAVLHRSPPGGGEVLARSLPDGVWRIDWLVPSRGDLITPEELLDRIGATLDGWCGAAGTPPYELLDTGVYTVHHRLAQRWRVGRAFLAGDAAHLLGSLGTQQLDEGFSDVANLVWKLALAWHQGASEQLLDSYQAERRSAVGARLRATDQLLPLLRSEGTWPAVRRSLLPGAARSQEDLLTGGHLGSGPLGASPVHADSPLVPPPPASSTSVDTSVGAQVADVEVITSDGSAARLHDLLGGRMLVLLIAPGTAVWDHRHWLDAGLMPRLTEAVTTLPVPAEFLVAESYPGAAAHTVLLIRPDGHLVTAMAGVHPSQLHECADAARGGAVSRDP
ncbi:FAD-dependent monooxygenase [Streptomyces sp. TP-A0874]|uniref:FAD-dependent monooxygenase n=1 Tax=Streptomyces sp. TP-A0874 TaxID=549819 RepID=UPI00085340DE|nr:FAD-dependent monooxygenase [Streptomyces sp. TP-A0874]